MILSLSSQTIFVVFESPAIRIVILENFIFFFGLYAKISQVISKPNISCSKKKGELEMNGC